MNFPNPTMTPAPAASASSAQSGNAATSGAAASIANAATIRLIVEPQAIDPSTSQVQFNVRLENPSNSKLRILSLRPLIPSGAEVQQVIDTSLSDTEFERKNLCREMEILLTTVLLESSAQYRKKVAENLISEFKVATKLSVIARLYFAMFNGQLRNTIRHYTENSRAWRFRVWDYNQAKHYYEQILLPREVDLKDICILFRSKMEALRSLDGEIHEDAPGDGERVADVERGGVFARTYIFNCQRRVFNPKTYTFAFDCIYAEESLGGWEQRSLSASAAATTSPKPFFLNIVAMTSALLGMTLKILLDATRPPNGPLSSWPAAQTSFDWAGLLSLINTQHHIALSVSAIITAIFFYNIYESTEVGKKLNVGSGWRSALLIGGLSGLLNDRVVAALQGLLG